MLAPRIGRATQKLCDRLENTRRSQLRWLEERAICLVSIMLALSWIAGLVVTNAFDLRKHLGVS